MGFAYTYTFRNISAKKYGGATTEALIDEILSIFEESSNEIGMISFTDHNQINVEAY